MAARGAGWRPGADSYNDMKFSILPLGLVGGVLFVVMLLAGPSGLQAQSSRPHKKAPAEDTDDASPSPSPSASPGKRRAKDVQAAPTPTPAPKPAATASGDAKPDTAAPPAKDKANPTSADEVAPSKSTGAAQSAAAASGGVSAPAATTSIAPSEIENFDAQPEPIRQLLTAALDLAKRNLTYSYGSADPAAGGMDCSGTIYYLLRQRGFDDVPRQASEQYSWVREKSRLYAVVSKKQDTAELREMRPGDLLFWTGTYNVDRDPPVTHTMIYLGRRKKDGHRLMFGASDGRPYDGQRRNGVSVFDFKMPAARSGDAADAATTSAPDHAPDFTGYGPIPGIVDLSDAASRQTSAEHATPTPAAKDTDSADDTPSPSPKPRHLHSGTKPRT